MADLSQLLLSLWNVAPRLVSRFERTTNALFGKHRFAENLTVRRTFDLATDRAARLGINIGREERVGVSGLGEWTRPRTEPASSEMPAMSRFVPADLSQMVLIARDVIVPPGSQLEAGTDDNLAGGETAQDSVRVGELLAALSTARAEAASVSMRPKSESIAERVIRQHIRPEPMRAPIEATPRAEFIAPTFSYLTPETPVAKAAEDVPAYGRPASSSEGATEASVQAFAEAGSRAEAGPRAEAPESIGPRNVLSVAEMVQNAARIDRLSARLAGFSVGLFAPEAQDFSGLIGFARRFGSMRDMAPRIARFIESVHGVHAMNDASVRALAPDMLPARTFVDVAGEIAPAQDEFAPRATESAFAREAVAPAIETARLAQNAPAAFAPTVQAAPPARENSGFIARSLLPEAAQSMGWVAPARESLRPGAVASRAEQWATGLQAAIATAGGESGLVALAPARQFLVAPERVEPMDVPIARADVASPRADTFAPLVTPMTSTTSREVVRDNLATQTGAAVNRVANLGDVAPSLAEILPVERVGAAARVQFAAERIGPRLIAALANRRAAIKIPTVEDFGSLVAPNEVAAIDGAPVPTSPVMRGTQAARNVGVTKMQAARRRATPEFFPTFLSAFFAELQASEQAITGEGAAPMALGGVGELGVVAEQIAAQVGMRAASLMTALVDPVADFAQRFEAAIAPVVATAADAIFESSGARALLSRTADAIPTFSSQQLALLAIFPQMAESLASEAGHMPDASPRSIFSPTSQPIADARAAQTVEPVSRSRRTASLWTKVTGAPSRLQGQLREFVRTRRQPAAASEMPTSGEPLWQKLVPATVVGATFHDEPALDDGQTDGDFSAPADDRGARSQSRRRRNSAPQMTSLRPVRAPREEGESSPSMFARPRPALPTVAAPAPSDPAASSIVRAVRDGASHSRPSSDRLTLGDLTLISVASASKQIAASPESGPPPAARPSGPDAGGASPTRQTEAGGSSPYNEIEELARYVYEEFQKLTQIAKDRSGEPWES